PCDCDTDQDYSNGPGCPKDGGDCDDHDYYVNSKQTGWFNDAGPNNWDYNCDGTMTRETPALNCVGVLCGSPTQGYQTDVPCGMSGDLGTCMGLPCAWVAIMPKQTKQQRCH